MHKLVFLQHLVPQLALILCRTESLNCDEEINFNFIIHIFFSEHKYFNLKIGANFKLLFSIFWIGQILFYSCVFSQDRVDPTWPLTEPRSPHFTLSHNYVHAFFRFSAKYIARHEPMLQIIVGVERRLSCCIHVLICDWKQTHVGLDNYYVWHHSLVAWHSNTANGHQS